MIPADYALARNTARKVLRKYSIVNVPTDLKKICEGEGLEYIELDDSEELDGMLMELEDGTRVAASIHKYNLHVDGKGGARYNVPDLRERLEQHGQ